MGSITQALRLLAESLFACAAAAPLVLAGLRGQSGARQWQPIGLSAVVILATTLATQVGWYCNGGFHWNWAGKLACLFALALTLPLLPHNALRDSGILRWPSRDSLVPIAVSFVICASLGLLSGVSPGFSVDAETVAYQLLMPGLSEEPVYRAIVPWLLSLSLGSPWRFGRARLGWWWLASAALFGMGHAIDWSPHGMPEFQAVPFAVTALVGLFFGWLAARCGSVWPCVVCHGLINATGVAIALARQ